MSELPATRTPFTARELLDALTAAFSDQMGQPPTHPALVILAGQIGLETANGTACFDWDVGNFKAVPGADYQAFRTWEIVGGKRVDMVCRFAAFPSLQVGIEAYLHAMYTRWGAAWHYACLGDAAGFAHALKAAGYYTADEGEYARGVAARASYYAKVLGGDDASTVPELPPFDPRPALPDVTADVLDPDAPGYPGGVA